MSVLADLRPAGLDLIIRPGNTITVVMEWPAGELVGRTITAELDGQALDVATVGDTLTVVASAAITGALTIGTVATWELLEDLGGATPEPIAVGRWTPSDDARAIDGTTVQVVVGTATVAVEVASAQASVAELAADVAAVEADVAALDLRTTALETPDAIAHRWDLDGWEEFTRVVITAHGAQEFTGSVVDGRGVLTPTDPVADLGSHRAAYLRAGTSWADAEVRSVIWGPSEFNGNDAQQGHIHRAREISPGLWEGIAVWTSVVFGGDYRFLHVASVRFDGTTLWQSTNDGGAGSSDSAYIDRRVGILAYERINFGVGVVNAQVAPVDRLRHFVSTVDLFTVASLGASLNVTDQTMTFDADNEVGRVQWTTVDTTVVGWNHTGAGTLTPSGTSSQKRWTPFVMATRVVGGTTAGVEVLIKRWRYGEPEPGWGDPRVRRVTVSPDPADPTVDVPEIALGPGLHGLWAAHFHNGTTGAWGDLDVTQL